MDVNLGTKVKFYPYRTARVLGIFFIADRQDMLQVEESLADIAKVQKDNHTVYELRNKDGKHLYISFSDTRVLIGSELVEERW